MIGRFGGGPVIPQAGETYILFFLIFFPIGIFLTGGGFIGGLIAFLLGIAFPMVIYQMGERKWSENSDLSDFQRIIVNGKYMRFQYKKELSEIFTPFNHRYEIKSVEFDSYNQLIICAVDLHYKLNCKIVLNSSNTKGFRDGEELSKSYSKLRGTKVLRINKVKFEGDILGFDKGFLIFEP
jgi:uncharacterized membrane protein